MTKSQIVPTMFPLSAIEHPRCPRCGLRMHLIGVSYGPAARDYRTFECEPCARTETVIADDPMRKPQTSAWLQSELKPPQ
jgi:hypothetical protein